MSDVFQDRRPRTEMRVRARDVRPGDHLLADDGRPRVVDGWAQHQVLSDELDGSVGKRTVIRTGVGPAPREEIPISSPQKHVTVRRLNQHFGE